MRDHVEDMMEPEPASRHVVVEMCPPAVTAPAAERALFSEPVVLLLFALVLLLLLAIVLLVVGRNLFEEQRTAPVLCDAATQCPDDEDELD